MLWGAGDGGLELRQDGTGGVRMRGRFAYGVETTLAPGRAERVAARAFSRRIAAGEDIHLLAGHDYAKPLASRAAGSLTLRETDQALEVDALLSDGTSWARDFLAAHAAGLVRGLSPGFRVPPGGDRVDRRGGGLVRTVTAADLFELSAVTIPAYGTAQLEARNWQHDAPTSGLARALARWRV